MYRQVTVLATAYLALVPSCASALVGSANVSCENGQHEVIAGGPYGRDDLDDTYQGIVFKREAIGICEPEEYVPDTPLEIVLYQLPDEPGFNYFRSSVTLEPPSAGVAYRYTAYAVLQDGSLQEIQTGCASDSRSYAIANCDGAPIARGRVFLIGNICLEPQCVWFLGCLESCWSESIIVDVNAVPDLDGVPVTELEGQVVDVFGDRTWCSLLGGQKYTVSQIQLAPFGACGPVPVRSMSWGAIKSQFD